MKITNLTISKSNTQILKNLNITFEPGMIHAIMGPNGSGKTTLSYSIAGHPDCKVESGEIEYKNKNLLDLEIFERSLEGIYLAPQYPSAIEGLSHAALLKEALNNKRHYYNLEPLDDFEFLKLLKQKAKEFNFDPKEYIRHSLNSGYSGGEKKRNEILQISLLEPDFIILDEIDSGLDIEAMKFIANFIVEIMSSNKTIIAITHYPNFAKLLKADKVHIMKNGSFTRSEDIKIVDLIEKNGFGDL